MQLFNYLRPVRFKLSLALALLTSACGGGAGGATSMPGAALNPPDVTKPVPEATALTTTCQGSATPPPATVLYAPVVPQPTTADALVGINIQNIATSPSESRYLTFGQVFIRGQLQPTTALVASFDGKTTPVQLDALANWPDGSVKLAALTLKVPFICAGSQVSALFLKAAAAQPQVAVNLATAKPNLTATLVFTAGSYTGSKVIDLGAALQTALTTKPDLWLHGPLVSQARVDVPLPDGTSPVSSSLRITADVSVFADGSSTADVQLNNDLTTVLPQSGSVNPKGPLPALDYTATITFMGKQVVHKVSQHQYTNWHTTMWSGTEPRLNVQRDIAYLIQSGAVLPYDLATGVNNSLLQTFDNTIVKMPTFGLPLSGNGITPYMPTTGGRSDIGFTTLYNTAWLMTQDARAARLAQAQSDSSGAIPWNYRLPNGSWLTPDATLNDAQLNVWVDGRGGPQGYTSGIANLASTAEWTPDNAHQPNLNYVPYLMSGARWNLDRLNAQAAFNLTYLWPGLRCKTTSCNILLNGSDQLRGQAWGFREVKQAAFIGKTGTAELRYFEKTVQDNWDYLQTQQPIWASKQGETTGWIPGDYGNAGATAQWQQDFMTTTAVMAGLMGDAQAREFVAWQLPWLTGRFTGPGMNPRDGCNYNLVVQDGVTKNFLNTWADIQAATSRANLSNGNGWSQSGGYYCALARSALNGALIFNPDNNKLKDALNWLEQANAPYTDQASFRNDPTFNVRKTAP